jgi:hypothetical protein
MKDLLSRMAASTEARRVQFGEDFEAFAREQGLLDWEGWFHPYDDETYGAVLRNVGPSDVVLEIGAGDLRLALQLAQRARRVYAVEVHARLLGWAMRDIGRQLPHNLHVLNANALEVEVPPHVTVATLLMRHCAHLSTYLDRLQAAGCQRLITNARWKSGVEVIDLTAERTPFAEVSEGWYACRCGAVGYVGKGERSEADAVEVSDCPSCGAGVGPQHAEEAG